MSQVKIQGGASGSDNYTILAPATSTGDKTLTLPTSTATLASTDANTFTGVQTFPAGSVSAPAITTTGDTNTGVFFPAADTAAITTGGTERMRINSSGKVGIGVTPSAWTVTSVLQLSNGNVRSSGNTVAIGANWFFDGASKYIANDFASDNYHQDGDIIWRNAPSGTAGNSITWSERMRINADGTIKTGSTISVGGATPSTSGAGITFPATQSASSDANTLDDYEEGVWTPNQGAGLTIVGAFSSAGYYTKVGNIVTVAGYVKGATSAAAASGGVICTNLPFSGGATNIFWCGSTADWNATTGGSCAVQQNTANLYAVTAVTASDRVSFNVTYRT